MNKQIAILQSFQAIIESNHRPLLHIHRQLRGYQRSLAMLWQHSSVHQHSYRCSYWPAAILKATGF